MSATRITFSTDGMDDNEARRVIAASLGELGSVMRGNGTYPYVSGFALGGEWRIRDLATNKLLPTKFTTQLDASGYLGREHPGWDNSQFDLVPARKPLYGSIDEL